MAQFQRSVSSVSELPVHVQELLAAERNKVVQAAQAGQMLLQQVL